jgi:hypothetical protein
MRAFMIVAGTAALCLMAGPGMAADLAVPKKEAMIPTKAPAAEVVCLRWVEQNYSWYNYCDRIPHYSRKDYYTQFGGLF